MIDFHSFAANHGLLIRHLYADRITRCPTVSKPSQKNGAYFYAHDFGWCMDWAQHDSPVIWLSGSIKDHEVVKQKIKESAQQYYQDRAKSNAKAAKKAQWILSQCELNLHPYLAKKGFRKCAETYGLKTILDCWLSRCTKTSRSLAVS